MYSVSHSLPDQETVREGISRGRSNDRRVFEQESVCELEGVDGKELDEYISCYVKDVKYIHHCEYPLPLPEKFDWRELGVETPVIDPGYCPAIWDFIPVDAFEQWLYIYEGEWLDLSEQQVLVCNDYGYGCFWGYMHGAFEIFMDPGAVGEDCMPWTGDDTEPCIQDSCDVLAMLDGWSVVENEVNALKRALLKGPLPSYFTVYDDLFAYTGGCYEHEGNDPVNHRVLLVGWDDAQCDGTGGWIVKNCWGTGWGMDGYFICKYGSCNIGRDAVVYEYTPERPAHIKVFEYEVDDSDFNDDGRPDPGETVNLLIEIRNLGLDATDVEGVLNSDTPSDIVIVKPSCAFGDMGHLASANNRSDPFVFTVSSTSESQYVRFYFDFYSDEGGCGRDSIDIMIGRPPLLLVDDDGGTQYERAYKEVLDVLTDRMFDTWNIVQKGSPPADELKKYTQLIWYTAETTETIAPDTTQLKEYMDSGGSLFINGQNIGEEIGSTAFFRDYLHAEHLTDNNRMRVLEGVEGDMIGDGLVLITDGPMCNSPSEIAPLHNSIIAFEYYESGRTGMIYSLTPPIVVYMATSFEGISDIDVRMDLLGRILNIMNWLHPATKHEIFI
jgi:hypothetical protein